MSLNISFLLENFTDKSRWIFNESPNNQTIELNVDVIHVIHSLLEGIFLPLLCFTGLAGDFHKRDTVNS